MANPNVGGIVDNLRDGAIDDKAAGYVAADVLAGTYSGSPSRIIAVVTLTPEQTRCQVTVSASSYVITLPSPAACKGRGLYTISRVIAAAGGFSPAVTDPDGVATTRALTNVNGHWVGFSDGTRWYEVAWVA